MKNISILVLEDEPFQRLIAVTALQKLGVQRIHQAGDGASALAELQSCGGVDVVLCDLRMSGMDGLAFLRHASHSGAVRSVILSSAVEAPLRQATQSMIRTLGLECLGDLGKPFDIERAAQLLARYEANQARGLGKPEVLELPSRDELLEGLELGQFEAWFQPKVDLRSGELIGAEALARWRHPQHGVLMPAQFLQMMEAHGLINRMFWQIFRQGLGLQRCLAREGRSLNIAFNLQPGQLSDNALPERVREYLEEAGLPADGITFEVTETGLFSAPTTSLENLVRLRMMGCGLSMDDFGTGYSSLDRLCDLPFSQVKLDAGFARKLTSQPRSGAVISSAVALAKAMDISLIIEGIETRQQRERLLSLGCTEGQGFLFSRPLARPDFDRLLVERPTLH